MIKTNWEIFQVFISLSRHFNRPSVCTIGTCQLEYRRNSSTSFLCNARSNSYDVQISYGIWRYEPYQWAFYVEICSVWRFDPLNITINENDYYWWMPNQPIPVDQHSWFFSYLLIPHIIIVLWGLSLSYFKNFVKTISFSMRLAATNASIVLGSQPKQKKPAVFHYNIHPILI